MCTLALLLAGKAARQQGGRRRTATQGWLAASLHACTLHEKDEHAEMVANAMQPCSRQPPLTAAAPLARLPPCIQLGVLRRLTSMWTKWWRWRQGPIPWLPPLRPTSRG